MAGDNQTFDWSGVIGEISYLSSSYEDSDLDNSNIKLEIQEKDSSYNEINLLKDQNNSLVKTNKALKEKIKNLELHIEDMSDAIKECLIESGMFSNQDFNL